MTLPRLLLLAPLAWLRLASGQGTGNGISKATYAANDPIPGKLFLSNYLDVADASDECGGDVCECSYEGEHWSVQQGRVELMQNISTSLEGTPEGNTPPNRQFGIHLVNTTAHWTTGGMTVAHVESIVDAKLGELDGFDSFLDYSLVIYVSSLASLVQQFKQDGVPYLAFGFDDPLAAGNHWWGVFVRVPESLMTLELVSRSRKARSLPLQLETRVSRYQARRAATVDDGQLVLAVRRATSDLASVEGFYGALRANATLAEAGADNASARCYLWAHAAVDVCFVERAANATAGDFSVADFADMLFGAHEAILGDGKQNCGRDKWADLHYAYDAVTETSAVSGSTLDQMSEAVQEGQFDYILDYVESASSPYSCFGSHIHYIFDPTGWAIQLNVNFSRTMDGCSWRDSNASGYGISNFCWNGVCDAAVATESQSATHTHSHKHASHAGLYRAEQEMSLAEDAAAAGERRAGIPVIPAALVLAGVGLAAGARQRRRYRRIPEGCAPPCEPN